MLVSCNDQQAIIDTNIELDKYNWSYSEKVKTPFTIEQVEKKYNLFLNLRITSDYKYSNLFLLIHIIDPNGKKTTERRSLNWLFLMVNGWAADQEIYTAIRFYSKRTLSFL